MTMGLLTTLGPLYPGDPGEPNGEYACNVTTEPEVYKQKLSQWKLKTNAGILDCYMFSETYRKMNAR